MSFDKDINVGIFYFVDNKQRQGITKDHYENQKDRQMSCETYQDN